MLAPPPQVGDRTMTRQATPLDDRSHRVPQFGLRDDQGRGDRVLRVVKHRVRPGETRTGFDPQPHLVVFLSRQVHVVMAAGDLLHQRAGSGAEAVRRMVAVFAPTAALADLVVRSQGGIALREPLGVVAGQHHAPLGLLGIVAGHAVPVPNRLNVAWVVEHIGHVVNRCNLVRRTF